MKVFVSGATGFIGRHLVASLLADGCEVRAVARPSPRAAALRAQGVDVVEGDLRDAEAVYQAVHGCAIVHHLATVRLGATVDRLRSDPATRAGYDADVQATRTVVDAAVDTGAERIVYASTAGVHGILERVPADETHPLAPDTAHRRAKLEGEVIVRRAAAEHGIAAVCARLTTVYGPGDRASGRFFHGILDGTFRPIGPCDIPYHYTYVDDIVAGLRLCEAHDARGGAVLLGTDEVPTLGAFFEAIAEAGGVRLRRHPLPLGAFTMAARFSHRFLVPRGRRPRVIRDVEYFTLPRAYDVSRAKRVLGFRPAVSLAEGVRRTMESIRAASRAPAEAEAVHATGEAV